MTKFNHPKRISIFFVTIILSLAMQNLRAQCEIGETKLVRIPCITGWMTSPPRTEICSLPSEPGWYLSQANIDSQKLGGTGGSISINPVQFISSDEKYKISRNIVNELEISVAKRQDKKTAQLSVLLQSVTADSIPFQRAKTVSAFVTLDPWRYDPFSCRPGMTTNNCPHIMVPEVTVQMVCLPMAKTYTNMTNDHKIINAIDSSYIE